MVADQQDREREMKDREAERKERERQREAELYEQGQEAMDQSRWDRAINAFDRVIELKGTRVDAALYWKAYSQNRQGLRAESLATIAQLTKAYPNSRYLKDAKALEVEVRSAVGQPMRPENQSDEELKLMALAALQNADPGAGRADAREVADRHGLAADEGRRRCSCWRRATRRAPARSSRTSPRAARHRSCRARPSAISACNGGRESRAVLARDLQLDDRRRRQAAHPPRLHGRRREGPPADARRRASRIRSCAPKRSGSSA